MDVKSQIKKLIASNELDDAFEKMFFQFDSMESDGNEHINHFYNSFILCSGKYQGLIQDKLSGVIRKDEEEVESNKIRRLFLNLLDQVPDYVFNNKREVKEGHEKTKSKVQKVRENIKESRLDSIFEYDLFLSYSSKDYYLAKPIWEELRGLGFKVFLSDENLKKDIGASFFSKIQTALEKSKHFLLLCTNNSLKSDWVKVEYETFFNEFYIGSNNQRKLIILKSETLDFTDIPLLLKRLQIANSIGDITESILNFNTFGLNNVLDQEKSKNLVKSEHNDENFSEGEELEKGQPLVFNFEKNKNDVAFEVEDVNNDFAVDEKGQQFLNAKEESHPEKELEYPEKGQPLDFKLLIKNDNTPKKKNYLYDIVIRMREYSIPSLIGIPVFYLCIVLPFTLQSFNIGITALLVFLSLIFIYGNRKSNEILYLYIKYNGICLLGFTIICSIVSYFTNPEYVQ